jgi:conjugal transfer pilus assembly protein TraI
MGLLGRRKPAATPAPAGREAASLDDSEIPRYPPFVRGLPAAAPARLLATQDALIARLQDALAFSDARFTTLVRPVIARYAAFVHLLPASEAYHHRGAGGLLRHGLEVAFHAARASQGRVFALDRSPAERRELEPRWRLAAGLAGLCHDLGKPVSDLSVCDREGRTTWRPLLGSLTEWAAANGVERYFLRWREHRHARHETFALLVLERILTPDVTSWLVDADPEILQGLLAAVAGIDDGAVLGPLVREADRASVEQDLRENHVDPAASALGVPVDRYLLDAMRRLARGGRWQINAPGARLWMLAEGLHLAWPAGAEDVVALLAADKVPGIPRDPDTLADILLERGLAVPCAQGEGVQRYWRLAPAPLARDGQVVTLSMLRLAAPELVLAGAPPAPVGLAAAPEAATPQRPPQRLDPEPAPDEPLRAAEVGGQGQARAAKPSGAGADRADEAPGAGEQEAQNPKAAEPLPRPEPGLNPPGRPSEDQRPTEAARRATDWLAARGAGGRVLVALAGKLREAPGAWEERLRRTGEQLLILFPDGLADLGAAPQASLDALAQDGLLEVNPLAPLRRVAEIDGLHGALLSAEASRHLLALVGEAAPGAVPAGRAAMPDPPPLPAEAPRNAARGRASQPPARRPGGDSTVTRALVGRLRARDALLAGEMTRADGWLGVSAETVRAWAQAHGVQPYALIRTLGHLPGCRVTPDGGLTVREDP